MDKFGSKLIEQDLLQRFAALVEKRGGMCIILLLFRFVNRIGFPSPLCIICDLDA